MYKRQLPLPVSAKNGREGACSLLEKCLKLQLPDVWLAERESRAAKHLPVFKQGLAEDGKREVRAYLANVGVICLAVCLEIGSGLITAGFQQLVQSGAFDIGACGRALD